MAGRSIRHLLTAFISGEISPLLHGRVDSQQYALGLETCENFVPVNEGPLVKRPGFEFIRAAGDTASWLSAFRFSVTQEYALEWGEHSLRFYTNDGRIETAPNVPYEVATPYAAAEARYVSTQQSYDRLYMDHPVYPPARLSRTGAATFTYDVPTLKNGPFADANTDEAITITASATTGTGITLTAASAIFRAGHVGALFRLEAKDFSDVKVWEPGMKNISAGDFRRSDGKVYQAQTSGSTGSNPPTHTDGSEWDGGLTNDVLNDKGPYGVQWKYIHDRFGIVRITAIGGGGTTATADVVRRLPNSLTSVASWRWAYGLFSEDAGYPSIVIHWVGRQFHLKDFDLTASVAGDFLNYQAFTGSGTLAADLSFRRRLATDNPPIWALGDRQLLLGTADKEMVVMALNSQAAISGDNIKAEPQSFYGSEQVWPAQLGSEAVFVERGARRMRSSAYDLQSDRYQATDLTAAARHITTPGLKQLAVQRWPFAMLHAVREDGQVVTHPLTRSEIKGFCRIVPGGGATVLSAVAVMGPDGRRDDLWMLIERTGAAGLQREIWKQHSWRELGDDQAEAFYVDGGVKTTATGGQTHFSGLTHLASTAVAVLAGGAVIPGLRVAADGTLTLPAANVPADDYTLVVGLPYTATAITLRPAPQNAPGMMQGLRQRVMQAIVRLIESVGLLGGERDGDQYDLIDRPKGAAMNAPIPLHTGDVAVEVDMDPDRGGRVRFTSSDPLPATIAMMSFKIDLGEG